MSDSQYDTGIGPLMAKVLERDAFLNNYNAQFEAPRNDRTP